MAVEIDQAVPFLDVADQAFPVRSAQARRARQASRHAWDELRAGGAAAPPGGAADQAPEAAPAEQAVTRPSRRQLRAICRLVGELGAQRGGRARFVRVRTEVYTDERGPRPRGNGAGSPMRGRTSGYRPAGLRREDPPDTSRPGYPARRRAASLVACPGQTGPSVRWKALLLTERTVAPLSQASTPGSRPESSPRPTRRTAAQGHTGERL